MSTKPSALRASATVCVLLAALASAASAQIEARVRLVEDLQAGRLEAAGSALALLERDGIPPGNDAMQRIRALDLAELQKLRAAHARIAADGGDVATLLAAQVAQRELRDEDVLDLLLPMMSKRAYAGVASDGVGRAGLRLCRRGREAGLRGLRAVRDRWRAAPWALGNLALGLRLLGRYEDAAARYEELLIATRRAAWALNDAGLVELARGRSERALELLLEGWRAGSDGAANCGGNAARILMRRGRRGDLVQAEALLERIVAKDATRVRARFWLERLRRARERAAKRG